MVMATRSGGRPDSRPVHVVLAGADAASLERLRTGLDAVGSVEVDATATNSSDVVIDAYRHRPDVVLLDLSLPGLPAAETIRHILRAAPDTSVCLLAASETDPGISAALDAGARECITSTLSPEAIAAQIERLCKRT
jgi:two-component system nitrate/nitrite response regulator NarL